MTTLSPSTGSSTPSAIAGAIARLGEEAATLALTLLDPGPIIEEVERMHAFRVEADRVEATDPARASRLRERASRIGLGPCALTRGDLSDSEAERTMP